MAETESCGTEAMLIRPPIKLAGWLRQCAAAQTVQSGRQMSANKLAVAKLMAVMESETSKEVEQK